MFKKILVPADGSNTAEEPLAFAEKIAGRTASDIHILHVSKEQNTGRHRMIEAWLEAIARETKLNAEKYLPQAAQKEIAVISDSLPGDPAEQIFAYSEKENIDLILMASYGRSGPKRWVLGSVADKVARHSEIPVMLIKPHHPPQHPDTELILNKAIVSLDGSKASESIIPYVKELAAKCNIEIVLFEVIKYGYSMALPSGYDYIIRHQEQLESETQAAMEYLNAIADPLRNEGITVSIEVRSAAQVTTAIVDLIEDTSANLVAMSTHGRSGLSRWAMGSVADSTLRETNVPLLLVRPPKDA